MPKFCNNCQAQGHTTVECSKDHLDNPLNHADQRSSQFQSRTPGVRHNATVSSTLPNLNNTHSTGLPLIPVPIINEKLPNSCNECQALGHLAADYPKGQRETHSITAASRSKPIRARTQHDRQNASAPSPTLMHQSNIPSASLSTHNPHPSPNHPLSITPNAAHSTLAGVAATGQPSQVVAHSASSSANPSHPPLKASDIQGKAQAPPSPPPINQPTIPPPSQAIPPLFIPSTLHKPPLSISSQQKDKQQHTSTSFLPQQSNLEANQLFWNAVNHQLALHEQARLKAPIVDASNSPIAVCSLGNITPSPLTTVPHSSPSNDDSSSRSSAAADSQPNSPSTTIQGTHNPYDSFKKSSYDSEGEEPTTEPSSFKGHNTDELLWQRPRNSKRNKRHPDQPLKVQLRARKVHNPQP